VLRKDNRRRQKPAVFFMPRHDNLAAPMRRVNVTMEKAPTGQVGAG
jgi:hypothetical protein